MGMVIVFLISLVVSYFAARGIYRKQIKIQPEKKAKAKIYSGILGLILFFIINVVSVLSNVGDIENQPATASGIAFDRVDASKFTKLYNDDIGSMEASGNKDYTAIKITGADSQKGEVRFSIDHGIRAQAQFDKEGQLTNVYWSLSKIDDLALLSMASVIEVLDATTSRAEALDFLKNSLDGAKDGKVNLSSESKKVSYQLSKTENAALVLLIEPKH